ncbi:NACHT domain-containing protein [Wolbachia endosymbiont (group B) of Archips podanus]|uniref:NACHT domain-containing protein n=1 Tax=Wolbachia endosymbiont (group B) of Archips podanus TaxID=2953984 RepID=UPI002227E916|nr:NACHT domain-containing protein [Wolbachia endosymbiont (group B) of Archips podanus]
MLKVGHQINYLKKEKISSETLKEIQHVKQLDSQIRFKRSDDNLKLPENFRVGQAIADGNCFFDSFRQGLEQQLGIKVTVEQLRQYCKEFAQNSPPEWFINAIAKSHDNNGAVRKETPDSYIVNILSNNRWGDSEVEGRILCEKYRVKLHIIEKHAVEGKEVWLDQIVNSGGSRSVDSIDYNEENTIHIINRGSAHFEPILGTQGIQYNKQQSREEQLMKEERPSEENKLNDSDKKSQGSEQQSSNLPTNGVKRFDNDPNRAGSSQQSSSDDNRIQDESWTSNQEHAAGELKRSLHGNDYQLKLLMLFASKGKNSEVAFRLATEMAEAEKFDDLVFRYTDSQGNIKYRFLQAKHRQFLGEENKIKVSDLKSNSDDNDFSLQKYFVSYLRDIEKKEFRDGVPEDFIICTNTNFDFEPSTTKNERKETKDSKKTWKAYFSEKTDDDTVLNLGGKRYQFNKDLSIRTKIISELEPIFQKSLEKNKLSNDNVEKIGGFLDKLVFAVEQPSGASLEQKIKDTIGNEFNLINEIIYNDFFKFMHDWMKHRKKDPEEKGGGRAHFLTDKDIEQFLSEASKKIASLGLISSTLLCKRKTEKFGLRFKDGIKAVQEIGKFLSKQGSEQILIVYSKSGLLSEIKVSQILTSRDTRSIFSDLKSLSLLLGSVVDPVNAFSSQEKDYLIITNLSEDAEDLLKKFYEVVKKEPNKKIVLITQPKQNNNIQKFFPEPHVKVKGIEDNNNKLKDLTSKSKEKILETEITLFGEKRKLTSLTTDASKDDLYSAIDGDALTTLINGDSNVIGSEHKYDFDTYIDIPRTLTYQTKIDKKCLEENKNDLFAISNIEKSDFSQLASKEEKRREFIDQEPNKEGPIRLIRLDNHRDIKKDFDQLCRDYEKYTIHLLENKKGALEWKQSHGSLFNLRRFVLKTKGKEKQIKDLTDSAIIAGEPGMGKSTILTTYSMNKDSLWTIRINLKDYQTDINNANFDDLSGIVGFLSNVIDPASSKTSLIKNLLQYCLKQQGQVTLLLDGYDEIKDHSQKKVELLLRTLKTTQGKVLITTRSYARSELEDALGIFAYSLNPFDEEKQKEFLKKFWIERLNVKESTQEEKIDEFTTQLLKYFHELNLMKKEGLVGIVLQARMVAEIFQDECKEYLKHEQFNSYDFGISNISDLYEKFIEYQYERYLKERIEISTKLSGGSRTSLTRSYTKAYGDLALKSLFSEDQIQGLLSKEIFLREELQDIGLVKTLKNDDTADFLHPTYAEYFVADFLVNALRKEKDHPKYRAVDNFLRMQIFRDHNKVIRSFVRNKIENDSDLSSKWKAIEDCDLLKEVENIVKLQPAKSISVPDHLNPTDDALSEKSLSDLQQDVEECMNWQDDRYYYNGGTKLINKLFQKFLRETDIKALETTLEFLLKANGKSYYGLANQEFSRENNIARAIEHYFSEVKKKGTISSLPNNLRNDYIKVKINNEEVFTKLEEILKNLTNTNNKEKYLKKLIHLLIPKSITSIEILKELNNLCYSLDIVYPNIIDDVKSYIKSTEDTKKKYAERIINSLKDINCGNCGYINHDLENSSNLKSLQSFFIDILYHPSVIAYTKSSINEIYKGKGLWWLERKGVLISRVLEILTPEMSERFNSVLDGKSDGGTSIYSDGIFVDLINYIVNRVEVEEFPQINKLAFLKMLVRFVGFSVEENRKLPFTSEQLKTTLKFIKDILSEQRQTTFAVLESIDYLFILGKAGLKLIDAKKELLVIDPEGEFEYKLSSDYINQIIELIKWKSENPSEPRTDFLKKCYETIELKKGNLNRKGSESELQELERLKVKSCLLNRRKREAESECLFTWEDVDEFNEEKDEKRDLSKIKIDSEKFVSYIKDLPEEKQSQLIQLASGVKITGESQGLVSKLISNQKVMNHLSRVGKISGMTMHGMMAKNVLADFLNGDYQGVAVNVGFIAGGQGFAKVAEAASLKGLKLASEGKLLLGKSLRAASPFLARGTSAFVVYDLVNQIKAFKNGTEEALVGVVGDSIYLGVDAAEIGIEIAEAFEVLEGVSSVTGPIGATIGAVVFVGTDVYIAVKRVDKIDQLIHLTGKEKFIEGLRAFIGMQPENHIQELLQEKEVSNELVRQGLEYLNKHSNIQSYVFPTGKSVVDSCRKVPYQVSDCASGGFGGGCLRGSTVTRYAEECTTKFEVDLDNKVILDRKRTDIKWSRARPDNPSSGKLFCLPRGNDEPVPSYGSYLCENAIGLSTEKKENYTLIDLGKGDDYSKGFLNSPNIFVVGNGFKRYYGGNKDDMFILQGDFIEGYINGGGGVDTVDLGKFASEVRSIQARLGRSGYIYYTNNNSSFGMENINRISGRKNKSDIIICDYNTKYVDGQGGENDANPDVITIPSNPYFHEMHLIVRSSTSIVNHANIGSFNYTILPERGKAQVSITLPSLLIGLPTDKHNFFFNSTISDLVGIYIQNINQIFNYTVKSATFSFLSNGNKSERVFDSNFDKGRFNVTISDIPVNASYILSNGAEIKIGNKGNMYMFENTNRSAEEIIKNYLPIANRLNKMSFFIQSVLSNETVVIGSGNHEVIHNNPVYRSHLVGNGGENVYVIDSEIDNVPEVIIHDIDEENSIDTIDLRNVVKKGKGSYELKVVKSENDLLLRATVEKHEYFTVRLKDGVERYNKTHVIVENAPMRISVDKNEWSLKPQPLVFEKDKEVIVVTDQDVDKGTEIITPRKGGNYTFVRSNGNDLMITNAFDIKNDFCSITLSKFYEIPKMKTLSVKFADKEIVLKDHQEEISAARDVNIVKKEYKDQVYNDVFNRGKQQTRHRRHKDLDKEFLESSSSTRPSSWINDLFDWVKSSIGRFRAALPETSANYSNEAKNPSNQYTSQFDSEVCISNNVGLGFFLLQSFLDKKYPLPKFCSVTPEEVLANTLNIVEEFEKTLEKTAKQSGVLVKDVNFFKIYLDIAGHVRNERYSQIPNTLYSAAKEACPKDEKFLSILKGNIEKMLDGQQIVNNRNGSNQMQNTIGTSDKMPLSSLNRIAIEPLNGKKGVTCAGRVA